MPRRKVLQVLVLFAFIPLAVLAPLAGEMSVPERAQNIVENEKISFSIVNTYFNRFLRQGTTLSILHTKNGRLWIANYDGVLKARGKSVQYHNELFASTSGLSQLRIIKLVETWNGKVLAVTESSELLVYEDNLGFFKALDWLRTSKAEEPSVSELFFSRKNVLWFGLKNGEVLRAHEDGRVEQENNIKFDDSVTDFYEDERNGILLVSSKSQVAIKEYGSNKVEVFDIDLACGRSAPIQEVASTSTGDILIGTFGGGLLLFDVETTRCRQVDSGIDTQKDFHRSTVHDLTVDESSGDSIVSTDQGIFIFSDQLVGQHFNTTNSKLLNNEVISIASDQSGGYWVGTYNGINRLIASPFELYDNQTHQDLHSVVAFESLGNDGILVASYSGLILTDLESSTFSRFEEHSPDVTVYGERIMSVFAHLDDIYLGYRNSGFEIINLAESSSSRWNKNRLDGLTSNSVSAFLQLDSEKILIGTYGGGVTILDSSGSSENIQSGDTDYSLRDDRVLMLYRSLNGLIWVGTESGLQIFDSVTHRFASVKFTSHRSKVPERPVIWSMAESSDFIWFGSLHHGLFKLEKSSSLDGTSQLELEQVEFYAPIPGLTIYAIETGAHNEVWFSTNQGISRLANNGSLYNFGHTHGLQETEFELGSSYKDSNGLIYFGGNHGYNRFDPDSVVAYETPSELVFNRILLSSENSVSSLPISKIDSIVLNHKDRFITFEFSALDYTDPESTRYRHKLIGFDDDWIDIGNRGSATYTSLPAGDYQLRVQAVNSAGIWNYEGLSMDLRVKPAPWLTWWAYAIYLLVFLGLAALFLKFYRNYMLKEQQLKQANELQRVADRFADELQDQIDFKSKLTDSIHSYNKQLLYWAKFCTDSTVEYEAGMSGLAHDRIMFRLGVLDIVHDSLYYQGERLYANLHTCATMLVNKLCADHPAAGSRLTAVNDVPKELIPAAQAVPLAIILAELLDNSLTHAFAGTSAACFVRFSVTIAPGPGSGSDQVRLVYQDSGDGIPAGLEFDSPESAGFAIIGHAANRLDCELTIGEQDRSMVIGSFDLPWS